MKTNDIIACGASLYRVLNIADGTMLVMDCLKPKMPFWLNAAEADCEYITEQELYERTGRANASLDDLDAVRRRVALNRYTIITGVPLGICSSISVYSFPHNAHFFFFKKNHPFFENFMDFLSSEYNIEEICEKGPQF